MKFGFGSETGRMTWALAAMLAALPLLRRGAGGASSMALWSGLALVCAAAGLVLGGRNWTDKS